MSAATSGAFAMDEPEGGSTRAEFVALYRTHASFTWSCLRRLGVPSSAIDDAMQELWVTAHRRIDTLHGPSSAKAWLYGIARRVASHHRRSERRHRRKLDALGETAARHDDAASREAELVVESILAQLDARVREAFVLSELEGWSAPEIARATGANTNTIYWRVRVARQELQSQLGDDEAGARVIELRDATRTPRGAARHCWVLIAPKLVQPSLLASVFGSFGVLKAAGIGAVATLIAATAVDVGTRPEPAPVVAEQFGGELVEAPVEATPAVALPVAVAAAPTTTPTSTSTSTSTTTSTSTSAGRGSVPASVAAPAASVSAPVPDASQLAAEDAGLLRTAKLAAACGENTKARAALQDHRRRFPKSELADVRDLLDVELRCSAGDVAGARAIATKMIARAPGSAAAKKVDGTCAGGGGE